MKWYDDIPMIEHIHTDRVWVVGDLHGCLKQFISLIAEIESRTDNPSNYVIVLTGDICDRGPQSALLLSTVMMLCAQHKNFRMVLGNHDSKLLRKLMGKDVKLSNGLDRTWADVTANATADDLVSIRRFFENTPLTINVHTPKGECVIAHAAFSPEFAGHGGAWTKAMSVQYSIFGPTDGVLENGFPNRIPWEDTYDDKRYAFYGHRMVGNLPKFTKNTCGVDTGCWETGILTAVSYPELEVIQSKPL